MFKQSIKEYMRELNPKYYKALKASEKLETTVNKMNSEVMEQYRTMIGQTRDKMIENRTWPQGTMEQLQELTMLEMEAQEIIRDQLASQIKGMR